MNDLKTIEGGYLSGKPEQIDLARTRDIEVGLMDIVDIPALGELWRDLQTRSRHSFFTSWGWIGCWLSHLPAEIRPQLLYAGYSGKIMGLGVLVRRRLRKYKMFPVNRLILHATGNPRYDQLTIEYNGILADNGMSREVVRKCLEFLRKKTDVDELLLSGLDENNELLHLNSAAIQQTRLIAKQPGYFIDLNKLRNEGRDYLAAIGANTRYQVKRSLREFEKYGRLDIAIAETADQAVGFLIELKKLHQIYWRKKGHPGAFANDFFEKFHRSLIASRFAHGEIQFIKTTTGSQTIGYLYNFIKDGHVYNYQSGFDYGADKKLKPGMVSHYSAIQYNLARGACIYDFLGGDSQYKRSLATESTTLTWALMRFNRSAFLPWI